MADKFKEISQAVSYSVATLRASGRPPPGVQTKPTGPCPEEYKKVIASQFDSKNIDNDFKKLYVAKLEENHDCISKSQFDLGSADAWEHHIDRKNSDINYVKQFKIPASDEQFLAKMTKELMDAGVIYKAFSPHNCPVFLVKKKDNTKERWVQDLRTCNMSSLPDRFSIRDCRESLFAIGRLTKEDRKRKSVFSNLDLTGAFHQLPLSRESQPLTAFTLPFLNSQFCWRYTTMGLRGASASFSKLINHIFGDLAPSVITYVDDILLSSSSYSDDLLLLDQVFAKCRYHGLKINLKKSQFGQKQLSWLGFSISEQGIKADYEKTTAIKALKPPATVKEIQSHLGLFTFFSHLVERFAWIAAPLIALTSQNSPWKSVKRSGPLPQPAMDAWLLLRQAICSDHCLAYPDYSKGFLLSLIHI